MPLNPIEGWIASVECEQDLRIQPTNHHSQWKGIMTFPGTFLVLSIPCLALAEGIDTLAIDSTLTRADSSMIVEASVSPIAKSGAPEVAKGSDSPSPIPIGWHFEAEYLWTMPLTKDPKGILGSCVVGRGFRATAGIRFQADSNKALVVFAGYAHTGFGVDQEVLLDPSLGQLNQTYSNHLLLLGLSVEREFLRKFLAVNLGTSLEIPLASELELDVPLGLQGMTMSKSGRSSFGGASTVLMIDGAIGHWFRDKVGVFAGFHGGSPWTHFYDAGSGDDRTIIDANEWSVGVRLRL